MAKRTYEVCVVRWVNGYATTDIVATGLSRFEAKSLANWLVTTQPAVVTATTHKEEKVK